MSPLSRFKFFDEKTERSPDLKDLISRMLVTDADARWTIPQIKDHPFFL